MNGVTSTTGTGNVAVLEDAVCSGKAIRFSHDPELVGRRALWREWQHLKNRYGYGVKYEVDGAWYLARSSD